MIGYLWKNRERPPRFSRPWFKAWAKRGFTSPALVASLWRIGRLRAKGARVDQGAYLASAEMGGNLSLLQVGAETFIGRAKLQLVAGIHIGARVCINDGAQLLTASHDVRDGGWPTVARPISVGDYAWIATNAMILPGVSIGCGAVVGAAAVVASDVPDYAVVAGNPARIIGNPRCRDLAYCPVRLLAVTGAWLGNHRPASGFTDREIASE